MVVRDPEFDALMLPLMDAVYDVALRLSGREHEAQDLTQETFARAFASFAQFERGSSPRAWLLTILRNGYRNRMRDAARRPQVEIDERVGAVQEEVVEPAAWEAIGPDDLDAAIQMLAVHHREVVILRDLQGLAYREIARILELPQGTVMSRLHRARGELRRILAWRIRAQARRWAR